MEFVELLTPKPDRVGPWLVPPTRHELHGLRTCSYKVRWKVQTLSLESFNRSEVLSGTGISNKLQEARVRFRQPTLLG